MRILEKPKLGEQIDFIKKKFKDFNFIHEYIFRITIQRLLELFSVILFKTLKIYIQRMFVTKPKKIQFVFSLKLKTGSYTYYATSRYYKVNKSFF